MPYGVIAPIDQQEAALAAGADYLESTIVGVLVQAGDDGRWRPVDVTPARRVPSFAILVPGALRVSDPSVPIREISSYFGVVLDAIAAVAEPGAKIVFGSGAARTIGPEVPVAEGSARFAEVLVIARDAARARDLEIVLEPLNAGETDLIHSVQGAVEFLDAHDIQGVRIVADLYHVQLEGESFDVLERLAGRIGHVHVADSGRIPPGQGDWPLSDFLAALRRGGYREGVTIECSWEDLAAELTAALAAVREADPGPA